MAKVLNIRGLPYSFGWTSNVLNRFQTTVVNTSAALQKAEHTDPELATAKSYDEVPHELSLPLIGSSWIFLPIVGKYNMRYRKEMSMKLYRQFGKIVRNDLSPSFKMLHIFDVRDIEKVFRYEGRYPFRLSMDSLKLYREKRNGISSNAGLLAEQGEKWYEIRTKVQKHMLRPASVHYYLPAMDDTSQELVQRISEMTDSSGEVPELQNELYKWALESIALVALDTKLGCLKKDITKESDSWKMIRAVNEMFVLLAKLEMSGLKLWKYFPSPSLNRLFNILDFFSSASQKHLNKALDKLKKSPSEDRVATFLENLLLKENMDMEHVIVMITDMLFGGIDTTSHSSAFLLYLLAKNQECQLKLYEEICRVLPDPSAPITVSVLNESRYLKAVSKESMRMAPIVLGNVRTLDKDIVLSGYRVPAGVAIITENLAACQLEENFPEPLKFKPERWLRGINEDKFSPFVFLPFGFGPRGCIGKRIAEQEMWTFVIRLFQKYRLEYHYEDINAISTLVNMPDKPLRFKFIQR